ncbi:MAG: methyltransferase domain-containing protein [Cyanobacteria bacterium J06638_22]
MNDPNQKTYASADIVWYYTQLSQLQPAEQAILDRFNHQLSSMKMLDIGIGGGRTTRVFAPLVKEYVGIDYSAEMVAACQKRFANTLPSLALEVADARDMQQFADDSFDFILFSFNGIDYVPESDRLKIFETIKRIGKSGGYFCFSSHNLQGLQTASTLKQNVSFNPLKTYTNMVMLALFKVLNPTLNSHQLANADRLIVRDESHNFRLKSYYIRPAAQFKQLEPYFCNVEAYPWQSEHPISDQTVLAQRPELWLYYLCQID